MVKNPINAKFDLEDGFLRVEKQTSIAVQQSIITTGAYDIEGSRKYFEEKFMEKDATSEQYLESVVQDVPLHEIRKVVDSCYFDEE